MDMDKPVKLQVACRNIRHKLMYVDERHMVPGMVDDSSGSRVFHCVKTMEVLGPDGECVSPDDCTPSRECYCR